MELKKALTAHISELQQICIASYSTYFYDYWNEGGLEWYLDREFSDEKLKSDLNDKNVDYYFIRTMNKPVGFIKISTNSLPTLPVDEGTELEKIYMLPGYKRMGIGKKALNEVIKIARERGKKILFLCVLDTNEGSIDFYEQLGFKFHSKVRLDLPYFKEELRGMHRMFIELN